jgi:pinin/SDK/memA/ protein conserved region
MFSTLDAISRIARRFVDDEILSNLQETAMETGGTRGEVNGKRQYDEASEAKTSKRPKLLSAIGTVRVNGATVATTQIKQSHSSSIERVDAKADHETLNPVIQDVYKRPEAVQRNKRLFGSLMGHLSLAKKKLEEDSSQIEKQVALQSAVVQRVSEENRRLEELHNEAFGAQKAKVRRGCHFHNYSVRHSPTLMNILLFPIENRNLL